MTELYPKWSDRTIVNLTGWLTDWPGSQCDTLQKMLALQWLQVASSSCITIPVHWPRLRPHRPPTGCASCRYGNGQACRCPQGPCLDRFVWRPLSVERLPTWPSLSPSFPPPWPEHFLYLWFLPTSYCAYLMRKITAAAKLLNGSYHYLCHKCTHHCLSPNHNVNHSALFFCCFLLCSTSSLCVK